MNSFCRTHLRKLILKILALGVFVSNWAARHRFVAAYLIVVLSLLPLWTSLREYHKQGDISVYESDADDLLQGRIPYRDTLVEYPPYAIPIFLVPEALGKGNYFDSFKMITALCELLIRGALFFIALQYSKPLRSLLPLICYCTSVPFLRFFLFQRFDLWPALGCVTAVLLFCAGKPGSSGFAVAIGIGVKVYPAVFVPPLFILALGQGKARRFSIGLILGMLPLLALSFVLPWWHFAQLQGDRGLQCESLVASLVWGAGHLGLTQATWVSVKRWTEVPGDSSGSIVAPGRGRCLSPPFFLQ